MKHIVQIATAILAITGLALLSATTFVTADRATHKVLTEQREVESGEAKSIRVDLDSINANINIHSGTEKLLNANFAYSLPEWKPELRYDVNKDKGMLAIHQPSSKTNNVSGNTRNEWNLALNNIMPMELNIESISGDNQLDLTKHHITGLNIHATSGDIKMDLAGNHPELSAMDIKSISGNISAELKGFYSSLGKVNLDSTSGNISLDLSGNWTNNAKIAASSVSGDVNLIIPANIGVRVHVHTISGDVNKHGLSVVDKDLVNKAYGKTKTALDVEVRTTSGDIDVTNR